jgi:uncharacterized membrane protein
MSAVRRLAFALVVGLVLGLLVHFASVLAFPRLAELDAYSRVAALAPGHRFTLLPRATPEETPLPFADPNASIAACVFDLSGGPLRVKVPVGETFLSMALHQRHGGVFYAITDRSSNRGLIDMVVLTQQQLDILSEADDPDEPVKELRIVSPERRGFVLVRSVALVPSARALADALAGRASCATEPMPAS